MLFKYGGVFFGFASFVGFVNFFSFVVFIEYCFDFFSCF